ncbi:hypothetical protein BGZ79_008674 [Entomortierella chlamydospora]|nr:hypothetical protein BGZ79_008674 [Entomortierella chlamydospora]
MLNRIGMQYASSIKYDHVNYVFVITGNEPKMQKQALIALNDLIEDQRPALVNYPQKPFRDLEDLSSSIASRPQADTASGLLIDVDYSPSDSSYLQATPSQETKQTIEFQIDDRVRDPYEMYFADKREKVELPIMLGERFNCNAIISGDGRTITVSGNSKDVSSCVSQIKQMQDYFLRPPFRLDKVALVYGSSREEFRLQFVPVVEHLFYSTYLEYLPSSFGKAIPGHFCVIEKAVYDASRAVWAIRDGVRINPRPQVAANTGSQRGSVGPGRGTPPSSRQAYSRLQGPVSSSTEWHEQENPNFGFGPTKESSIVDKQTRPSSWKPIASNSKTVQQNSSQIPWQSSGTPGNLKSQSSSTSQSNITRREVQPEWPAQSFETKDEDDFPSLGSVSKSASKSVSRPSVSPTPPKSHKPKTYKDEAGAILDNSRATTPQHMTSRSNSIVFGEQDLAYLENIPAQRSAVSRPREHDNIGLEQAALRDPTKDQEDAQRTIRSLPRLQASPETPIQRQVTPQAAFITGMRNYNMRRLSESIRNGLKELRGQRKEIRLVGRLGCVLYPMDNFILNQFWEYTQLESVIVKKREIRPVFSPIVTTNNANFNSLYGFLRTPKTETAHFEIECDTRINPTSRFTKTLVTVPTTIAVLDRVVTPWETFGEVIWNSVDKNMDFEILLQAREGAIRDTKSALGRTDVKPFSAFRKRLSIGMRNSHITCHEIKPLLEVRNINFRETLTYEKPGKFTFVVHKVEELQLTRTQGVDAVTGRTSGPGKKWYEFEVYNEVVNSKLRSNLTVIPGAVADWTVEEIVGQSPDNPDNSDELIRMVKALMVLVDNCQEKFNH